jgi:hypothetical protein
MATSLGEPYSSRLELRAWNPGDRQHRAVVIGSQRNGEPIRALTPPDPRLAQVVLAQAAELGRQAGFQANATHLEFAYRVRGILVAADKGELAIPYCVDREAVRRFVDEVFFARQFLDENIHLEAKARASRTNVAQPWSATGVLIAPETLRTAEMMRIGQIRALVANPISTQT